jgi:DnaJ-class molecular chaperone
MTQTSGSGEPRGTGVEQSNPGDEAPPGTPGTGEDVCAHCSGKGRMGDGSQCQECAGTGKVVRAIGGG